ncbi:hypothetical protein DAPPUDRAFT_325456 [Daphnia pulex]|uniref:Uncharacterized protein n=1 Tax=Daphnia pulex TaxID=6669 RepID=E9H4S4_DAPPU|nr:hypothetical protein DAPPUDRAFT_325456 [Daphnia pulex]|eukprot:EFX73199.1 hypothetical protein DAPPUDRAFT_325456 [Daphnia pulex]
MYSNLVPVIKKTPRFLIIFGILLLLVVISTLYLKPTQTFYQQGYLQPPTDLINVAFQEKKALEQSLNVCRDDKKDLANLLDAEKEIRRKVNATSENIKLYEEMIQ